MFSHIAPSSRLQVRPGVGKRCRIPNPVLRDTVCTTVVLVYSYCFNVSGIALGAERCWCCCQIRERLMSVLLCVGGCTQRCRRKNVYLLRVSTFMPTDPFSLLGYQIYMYKTCNIQKKTSVYTGDSFFCRNWTSTRKKPTYMNGIVEMVLQYSAAYAIFCRLVFIPF